MGKLIFKDRSIYKRVLVGLGLMDVLIRWFPIASKSVFLKKMIRKALGVQVLNKQLHYEGCKFWIHIKRHRISVTNQGYSSTK